MTKIVQVSNDVESAFYMDGALVCRCEPDELDVIIRALGFDFELREDFDVEKFPEELEK